METLAASKPASPCSRTEPRELGLALISDDFLPAATGVGIHLQLVARELAGRGHRVCVITTRRPGQPARETWHGVHVHRVFSARVCGFWQALPARRTIRRIMQEHAIEIVHYHYLGFLMKQTRKVAAALGLRNLYTYHMTADHLTQPLLLRPFRPWIEREIVAFCNACDLVWAPSGRLAEEVRRQVRAPVRFLGNPVAFADAEPAVKRPADPFTVLYAGRLQPEKNLPLLLRAFARLAPGRPGARLWIAGDGWLREALRREARELGIAGRTEFLGQLDHAALAERYAAADVFVLPSVVETQGLVALEAMRFAVPVIVTGRIVSARELVDHGENGYIVDAEDPGDLARRLTELHDAPALRARLGAAGRGRALLHTPAAVADGLVDGYAGVAKNGFANGTELKRKA